MESEKACFTGDKYMYEIFCCRISKGIKAVSHI